MLAEGHSPERPSAATVMSNAGLAAIRAAGGEVVATQVGDKHVIDLMLSEGYNLGGSRVAT